MVYMHLRNAYEMDLREIGREDVDWFLLAQDRIQWWAL